MRRMLLDSVELAEDFVTDQDGFLVTKGVIARTGIQIYAAHQLKMTDRDPNALVRVYRPPEEVFSTDALASMRSLPITNGHPGGAVTADIAESTVVGFTGSAERDGDLVRTDKILITHPTAIAAVQSGKLELSAGYRYEIVKQSGTTPQGEAYDAIQTQIRGNHVALVAKGRCGPVCRLDNGADSVDGCTCPETLGEDEMPEFIRDCAGVPVDFGTNQAMKAFDAMVSSKDKDITDRDTTIAKRDEKIAEDAKTLATKDAEIDELKSKLSIAEDAAKPENIEKRAAERSELVETAKRIAPNVSIVAADTAMDIRRKALVACDIDLEGKEDAYIEARFDGKADDAPATRHANDAGNAGHALKNAKPAAGAAGDAYQKYVEDGVEAWQKHLN